MTDRRARRLTPRAPRLQERTLHPFPTRWAPIGHSRGQASRTCPVRLVQSEPMSHLLGLRLRLRLAIDADMPMRSCCLRADGIHWGPPEEDSAGARGDRM
ncbi:glutamine synthetase [Marssonina coronariae]|uniref:Glutamine synthetase n=1 Tax=Diplocarpon coronariae TaxID=2795749 RepID=A0A218YVH5_9HELO|nr:glutamine synthetase [Marssonina coronariae]